MTFKELAQKRRSIRTFTDQPISDELRKQLLIPALMAPTSKSARAWQFILVDDKAKLHLLSESKKMGAQFVANAPLAIIVAVDKEGSEAWIEDASVASTMLMLQAEDLGLGSCWVQMRERKNAEGVDAEHVIRNAFGIPENYGILSVIAIGYKEKERKLQDEEKLLWDRVHVNNF